MLVVYFLLWSGDLILLISVVVFGTTIVFSLVRARVGLNCRRLLAGFAELSYVARVASVRSVGWGLSVGCGVLGVHAVRWVGEGSVAIFVLEESLLHFLVISCCVLYICVPDLLRVGIM